MEEYFGATQQEHEAVAEGLRRQVVDRDRQLAERREKVVEKYVNQAEVDAAENEASGRSHLARTPGRRCA